MSEYKLSEIASNEMKQFAMYTIANRAIPNMYDGLKPVQRFYLYSSIVNSSKEYKKVSAVSGVVSDYGYNHGESSAASAGQLMAAEWNNNVCLVEGRGSFGTRQIQQAGAARYVYTRLHSNFNKYIKDVSLAPVHEDPEHSPPAFYIPVVPLVLANGTRGIATGFATNILPRSVDGLVSACVEYLMTGDIKNRLQVTFPQFSGTTFYDPSADRFVCQGTFERVGRSRIVITEIPYGYDREEYVNILDKLEEDGIILTYEDQCSTDGFKFDVKYKQALAAKMQNDEFVYKTFKLEKTHSENITVIDDKGSLREYKDERDLIKDFCNFRLDFLNKRIELNLTTLVEEVRWLTVKAEFIKAVLESDITFKGKSKDQVHTQILASTSAHKDDCDRLLRMNIMSLTKEMIKELMDQIKESKASLKYWKSTTTQDQFISDLDFQNA